MGLEKKYNPVHGWLKDNNGIIYYIPFLKEGTAYKTTDGIIKSALTMNKNGKIISMKKSVQETIFNRLNTPA